MTKNGFLKFDLNRLTTQKASRIFRFKSTHDSKNFPELWFKSTHDSKIIWNIDLNQAMAQCFESAVDLLAFLGFHCWVHCWPSWAFTEFCWLFWAFTKFRWPFWAFTKFCWPLLCIRLKCLDSNQLMTQAVTRRLESIQLMTQAAFRELTQNQLVTQVDFPGIDSDWLMTSSPFSIQINSWLKQKAFDAESTHDSTLSHTHVCSQARVNYNEDNSFIWFRITYITYGLLDGRHYRTIVEAFLFTTAHPGDRLHESPNSVLPTDPPTPATAPLDRDGAAGGEGGGRLDATSGWSFGRFSGAAGSFDECFPLTVGPTGSSVRKGVSREQGIGFNYPANYLYPDSPMPRMSDNLKTCFTKMHENNTRTELFKTILWQRALPKKISNSQIRLCRRWIGCAVQLARDVCCV